MTVVDSHILGVFEISVDGVSVDIPSPKHRILLATLLIGAGQQVTFAELAEKIWGDRQPTHPRRAVQLCVTRMRSAAGAKLADLIVTCPDGYRLDVRPNQIDVGRFREEVKKADAAAAAGDLDMESAALSMALSNWSGEPLADIPSDALQREIVPALQEERLHAIQRRIDVDLRRGHHEDQVTELLTLTAKHPLRERFSAQLMIALHSTGRRADALAAYQNVRQALADELGVEPGEEIRKLHAVILGGQPSGQEADRHDVAAGIVLPVPRQLPQNVPWFVGRSTELKHLDAMLADHEADTAAHSVAVINITGMPGVGKTALAAHWARRVADRFPDGQLWINLRGYESGQAVGPEQALIRFLSALGAPGEQIPPHLDDQINLYRSRMDGRRMLLVLDNAMRSDQVRPLLPGAPGCLVVVTTRDRMPGLVAGEGAQSLALDLLSTPEAWSMLVRRLGRERVEAEPAAAQEIIDRCGCLPLALAIVAARATIHPQFRLDALARELADTDHRLEVLAAGDPVTDLRTVFSWSYKALSAKAAALFRLTSIHPGPDISVPAAASLGGLKVDKARWLLAELSRAHLLIETAPGRFAFHDLLRVYAANLTHELDPDGIHRDALQRMLEYYFRSAHAAATRLDPYRNEAPDIDVMAADIPAEDFPTEESANEWFKTERPTLIGLVRLAASTRNDLDVTRIAWTLAAYLDSRGMWSELLEVQSVGLDATLRSGQRNEEPRARRLLAIAYLRLGRNVEAHTHLQQGLDAAIALGGNHELAQIHLEFGLFHETQGQYEKALDHVQQCLDGFRQTGDRVGEAMALNALGWCLAHIGDYLQARAFCKEAVSLHRKTGDRYGQALALDSLGYAYRGEGEFRRAISAYQQSLALFEKLDDHRHQADTLISVGEVSLLVGDPANTRKMWTLALRLLNGLHHPKAAELATRLAAL